MSHCGCESVGEESKEKARLIKCDIKNYNVILTFYTVNKCSNCTSIIFQTKNI